MELATSHVPADARRSGWQGVFLSRGGLRAPIPASQPGGRSHGPLPVRRGTDAALASPLELTREISNPRARPDSFDLDGTLVGERCFAAYSLDSVASSTWHASANCQTTPPIG